MMNFFKSYFFSFSLIIFIFIPSYGIWAQDCSPLFARHRQAIVSLTVEFKHENTGAIATGHGTGFIVAPDGYVLTAKHVVTPTDNNYRILSIKGAIGDLDAPSTGLDFVDKVESQNIDIALLRFKDTNRQYSTVPVGKSRVLEEGQKICSLSFSAPTSDDYHITEGLLASKLGELWSTRMESNKGESGAPVFRASTGRVVAIKRGTFNRETVPFPVEPVNYLTPIQLANSLRMSYFEHIDFTDDVPQPLSITSMKITYNTGNNSKERGTEVTTVLELNEQEVGRIEKGLGFDNEWKRGEKVTREIKLNSPILYSQCGGLKVKVNKTGTHQWDVNFSVQGNLSNGRTVTLLTPSDMYFRIGNNDNFNDAEQDLHCPLMQ